jgi:hypothetical protein
MLPIQDDRLATPTKDKKTANYDSTNKRKTLAGSS